MAGPVVFAIEVTAGGTVRPGYDPVTQFVSELGNGPHALVYSAAVITFGLLELPFLLLLVTVTRDAATPTGRSGERASLLQGLAIIFSATTIFLGLVPTRHRVELQDASFLHVAAFIVGVISLIVTCLLMAGRFKANGRWPGMAGFSRIIGTVAIALLAMPALLGPQRWYEWAGLLQRLLLTVLLAWLEIAAIVSMVVLDSGPRNSTGR